MAVCVTELGVRAPGFAYRTFDPVHHRRGVARGASSLNGHNSLLGALFLGICLAITVLMPDQAAASTQVKEIQTLLNDLGYDAGRADGLMGRKTRKAIRTFQRDEGLPINGRPSRGLVEALQTAVARAAEIGRAHV